MSFFRATITGNRNANRAADFLREVVELALPSTPLQKKLLQRIDGEELFRSTEFSAHLSEESPIPGHCLCLLLTPFNDKRFKQECSHPRSDGAEPPTPVSMETQAFPSDIHVCIKFLYHMHDVGVGSLKVGIFTHIQGYSKICIIMWF